MGNLSRDDVLTRMINTIDRQSASFLPARGRQESFLFSNSVSSSEGKGRFPLTSKSFVAIGRSDQGLLVPAQTPSRVIDGKALTTTDIDQALAEPEGHALDSSLLLGGLQRDSWVPSGSARRVDL